MKVYLIVALFLGALVVAHSLEEEEEKVELPEQAAPPVATEGDMEETDDDVEKRSRNYLSVYSCGQLKRRGYCRYAFIKNLCQLTCSGCKDKLSSVSCSRIKYTYRQCNNNIGRVYCQRTCTNCGGGVWPPNDPCRKYKVLNQLNRRQSRPRGNVLKCDQSGFATRWYRFTGAAGNRMPTRAPPKNRCGTHAPGWLKGSYPVRRGQIVSRKVCYHWGNNKCNWSNNISVKHCGGYYVFYLRRTPVCNLRYCGNA